MEAFKDESSRGRRYHENYKRVMGNIFDEDINRLHHSRALRRLEHKTQVITSPMNTYIRKRMSHTREVVGLAKVISDHLGLNTRLCEAIAWAHDIGHTPYGHLGENVLSELTGKQYRHAVGSVVIAQHLESEGGGLNLSFETLEGILYHSRTELGDILKGTGAKPQEYSVVMYADKIAYVFSDLEDAIIIEFMKKEKLPDFVLRLGKDQYQRKYRVVDALIEESQKKDKVELSDGQVYEDFKKTREMMFNEFYYKIDNENKKNDLIKIFKFLSSEESLVDVDPIAAFVLLNDTDASKIGDILNEPRRLKISHLEGLGIMEDIEIIRKIGRIEMFNPDLNWGKK